MGADFAKKVQGGGVVCLIGNLGAGKTTFSQGLARGLGIKQNIISPTFILERRYKLPATKTLVHIDLYRLNTIEEAKGIGIEETMADPNNIVVIEWPEKIESLLPRQKWEVRLETITENERKIEILNP